LDTVSSDAAVDQKRILTVSASAGHDFNKRNVATCAPDMIWHYRRITEYRVL